MTASPTPQDTDFSFAKVWKSDLISGFLVFLIAMPLCLAIAKASNFPAISGIWTAVVGGILCSFLSNSQLTIKGPAAGLIVIVAGAVVDLGREFGPGLPEAEQLLLGYKLALGVGVVSGIIQILFGLLKVGKLGDFFPLSAVHGLLASIGIIIIAGQLFNLLGIDRPKVDSTMELLQAFPGKIKYFNGEVAIIGLVGLALMFGIPFIKNRYLRAVPVQLIVLVIAVPLAIVLSLDTKFLISVPSVLQDPGSAFAFPDFRAIASPKGLIHIVMFCLIGSLESLLSAKAVDLLDPYKRKTDLNRDLTAIGVANTASALLGGLPMISEIVRSSANINNGAKTSKANFFHGLFLCAFVILLPELIRMIPTAALAAMLIYTGFRLAHPKTFIQTYQIGKEQLIIFVTTIVVTLCTDLLIGIGAGIATKLVIHLYNGVPVHALFNPGLQIEHGKGDETRVVVQHAAVFSNWLAVRSCLESLADKSHVTLDLAEATFVDHSVMEKLHETEADFARRGLTLHVVGIDEHEPLSQHPLAARRKRRKPEFEVA